MTQASLPPLPPSGGTSNDELKAMLGALADAQRQSGDKMVEILVRLKTQDEKIVSHGTLLLNMNQRLSAVETKAERTARQQDEAEGAVLAEVGVLAANDKRQSTEIAAVKAETHAIKAETVKQSETLAAQSGQLEKLGVDSEAQCAVMGTHTTALGLLEAETKKQSGQLAEVLNWRRWALMVGAPGIWEFIQWLVHK